MTVIQVDFTGVEAGSNFVHIPEGDYGFRVTKVAQKIGDQSGLPYLLFSLKATKGNPKGVNKIIPHTCSLKKSALWNLRSLLEAAGKQIPSKALKIDLDKLVGLEMGASVMDDEYEGKKKSVVAAFFPLAELAEMAPEKEKEEPEGNQEAGTLEGSADEEEELFD